MDNEFNKVADELPQFIINTTAANEHVGEVEWHIRLIKEHAWGIMSTLPFKNLIHRCIYHWSCMKESKHTYHLLVQYKQLGRLHHLDPSSAWIIMTGQCLEEAVFAALFHTPSQYSLGIKYIACTYVTVLDRCFESRLWGMSQQSDYWYWRGSFNLPMMDVFMEKMIAYILGGHASSKAPAFSPNPLENTLGALHMTWKLWFLFSFHGHRWHVFGWNR